MSILGIDPGMSGALVLLHEQDVLECIDMPDTRKGVVHALQWLKMQASSEEHESPLTLAVIEEPLAIPGLSAQTVAKTHTNYGVLLGTLLCLNVPVETVRPSTWKARMGLARKGLSPKDRKALARQRAGEVFPLHYHWFTRAKDDGRAEAALLAAYAMTWVKGDLAQARQSGDT